DVGYGCGDSCFMLADRYDCNVTGLTNEKSQWLVSQTRLASLPCQNRVKLICGSATDDNLFDAAFDHIVSIDSAYHYDTRWKFLQTAQSQLVPGGTLGLYDLTIDPKLLQYKWLAVLMGRYVLGIPESNMVTADAYRDQLVAMGYAQVAVNAVPADRVFGGLSRFIRRQYAQAALWDILPPWGNRVFMLSSASLFGLLARKGWVVPVIVSARKKEKEEAHI
ncbi:S-adenosyl-L-methionine-dependent methyltransferase, partial [Fennellomyces sp. T-0311]